MMRRDSLATLIGAFVALVFQIVLAPNIAISSIMPNFLLAYVLVVALVRPKNISTIVLAFVFGLLFDLMGHGPVGAMALLSTVSAFTVSRLYVMLNNDTLFMPLATLAIAAIVVEALYAVFMIVAGVGIGFGEAFLFRALPSTLYDCVIGLILYPFAAKFLADAPLVGSAAASASARDPLSMSPTATAPKRKVSKKKTPRF